MRPCNHSDHMMTTALVSRPASLPKERDRATGTNHGENPDEYEGREHFNNFDIRHPQFPCRLDQNPGGLSQPCPWSSTLMRRRRRHESAEFGNTHNGLRPAAGPLSGTNWAPVCGLPRRYSFNMEQERKTMFDLQASHNPVS